MEIKTNSTLIPIIDVGMYYTPISPNEISETYWEHERSENNNKFLYEESFDVDAYKEFVAKTVSNIVDHNILKEEGIRMSFGNIYSPREYNFYSDSIDIYLNINKQKLYKSFSVFKKRYKKDSSLKSTVDKYIEDNWKSQSGFISLMPECFNDIIFDVHNEYMVSAMVTLLLIDKDILPSSDDQYNYYTDELYERMQSCDYSYINERQIVSDELVSLYNDTNKVNELYHDIMIKYGDLWKNEDISDYLCDSTVEDNDCSRFIIWANNKGYDTINKLENLANGNKSIL